MNLGQRIYEQWSQLEALGAIFLPAIGQQENDGTFYRRVKTYGSLQFEYWSASVVSTGYDTKYCMYTSNPAGTFGSYSPSCDVCIPVRLVQDIN